MYTLKQSESITNGLNLYQLFHNNFFIGIIAKIDGKYYLALDSNKGYYFDTIKDMFTALRILKDITK